MQVQLITLFTIFAATWSLPSDPRVIGGEDAARQQFPYMVSVHGLTGEHGCGGSILTTQWIISAGHCFDFYVDIPEALTVYAGLLVQREAHADVQSSKVSEVHVHPEFAFPYNDISLLKLTTALRFTKAVQPVALPCINEQRTGDVVLSGWGKTSHDPLVVPDHLQFLQMTLITVPDCNKGFTDAGVRFPEIIDTMVCTIPKVAKQSGCHGDSGGPIVQDGVLIGLVSGGDGQCGSATAAKVPNAYTRVSAFIPYITELTGQESCTGESTTTPLPGGSTTQAPGSSSKVVPQFILLVIVAVFVVV